MVTERVGPRYPALRRVTTALPPLSRGRAGPRRGAALWAGAIALAGGVLALVFGPLGTDLAAHHAWASFVSRHPGSALDFGWYGGLAPASYSPLAPYVLAITGVGAALVISTVLTAVVVGDTLAVTQARAPRLAASWFALGLMSNVLAGRVAFALGLLVAALAIRLVALAAPSRRRLVAAALLTALSALFSPLAAFFVVLIAGGLAITRRWMAALALGIGAVVPVGVTQLLFSAGGTQPLIFKVAWPPVVATLLVLLVVRRRVVLITALIYVLAVVALFVVSTPIGSNIERFGYLLAGPLVIGYAVPRRRVLVAVGLIGLLFWQSRQPWHDLSHGPDPLANDRSVVTALSSLPLTGRVEAVPEVDHWESTVLTRDDSVLLARGWERQIDEKRNPLFYKGRFTAAAYRQWLADNAVQYVVLANRRPDWSARREAALVGSAPSWLQLMWSNKHWRIYRVVAASPFVSGGTVVRLGQAEVDVYFNKAGTASMKLHYSRWLAVSGGGCAAASGNWVQLRVPRAGVYRITAPYRLHPGTC